MNGHKDQIIKPANSESKQFLVAYFSYSGNTKNLAQQIHNIIGGDIFEIQTIDQYPSNYNMVTSQAKQEIQSGAKPLLKETIKHFDNYKVVFLGFPNWWNTFPSPVLTFLANYDFTGKTIVPFCTHG